MDKYYEEIKKKLNYIIKANQSSVVETLLEKFPDLQETTINQYSPFTPEKEPGECVHCRRENVEIDEISGYCHDCHDSSSDPREVYQWWLIDDEWTQRFIDNGLVILQAFGCSWFGRTCGGQSLHQDQEFDFLAKGGK